MPALQRIIQKVVDRDYYLSSHAEEELFEDGFDRYDLEHAILKGRIEKKMDADLRGTRFRIEGPAPDGRVLHAICRFKQDGDLIVITVYERR